MAEGNPAHSCSPMPDYAVTCTSGVRLPRAGPLTEGQPWMAGNELAQPQSGPTQTPGQPAGHLADPVTGNQPGLASTAQK